MYNKHMKQITSAFKNSSNVTNGRRFLAYLMDMLTVLILTMVLFAICDVVGNATISSEKISLLSGVRENLQAEVLKTKLDETDSDGALIGNAELTKKLIIRSTLYTLKANNVDNISQTTYQGYEPITPFGDGSYYFHTSFKKDYQSFFVTDDADKDDFGSAYYRKELISSCKKDLFVSEGDYPYLTLENAKAIDNYYRDSSYSTGLSVYQAFYDGYNALLTKGVNEYTSYYGPYLSLSASYNLYSESIYYNKQGEMLFAYCLSILLVYILAPFILKDGMTVTYKIMRLGLITTHEERPSFLNNLLRSLVISLEFLFIIPCVFLCFYGTQSLPLLSLSVIPGISIIVIGFVSLFLSLASYVVSLFHRESPQSLSEMASLTVLKDGREYVVEKTLDNNGKNNNR